MDHTPNYHRPEKAHENALFLISHSFERLILQFFLHISKKSTTFAAKLDKPKRMTNVRIS